MVSPAQQRPTPQAPKPRAREKPQRYPLTNLRGGTCDNLTSRSLSRVDEPLGEAVPCELVEDFRKKEAEA